ncbi:MAG: SurA N-terminal domain-containing protein [Spirochaetaceae bacterium]|jgi:hypothetical protein|nr:SurA N-terminal domain-containing protein [Spirochaetaceae bacterium]
MTVKESKSPVTKEDSVKSDFVKRFKTNPFVFIGTIIVLIIVIAAFVLVPAFVPEVGLGQTANLSFGSYNKIPITYVPGNYFSQIRETIARYYQQSSNENSFLSDYQVWRQAFNETVVHTGILDEVKRAGYEIPDSVVDREVALLPQFQENGRFSTTKYRKMSNTDRMALWRQVRESLIEEVYREDMSGLRVASQEASFLKAMASTVRRFDMISFPLTNYPEEEIVAYINNNPDRFRSIHLSKITITASQREAQQVLASVRAGTETFEDAARNHSTDEYAEQGGDMGLKMIYELANEIPEAEQSALFSLEQGTLSNLITLESSWVFFRIEEAAYNADTNDPSTINKIRSYLLTDQRGQVEDYFLQQAQEFVNAAAAVTEELSLDDLLAERGLEKKSFGPLPLNYGSVDLFTPLSSFEIAEFTEAAYNENFWQTAYIKTAPGTLSSPIVIGSNVVVLYPIEETIEADEAVQYIETAYSSYWIPYVTNQTIQNYFLTNEKLKDEFWNTYVQNFMPAN